MVRLTHLEIGRIQLRLLKRGEIVFFESIAIGLSHEFIETFLVDILLAEFAFYQ
jgi:hypothetical protein